MKTMREAAQARATAIESREGGNRGDRPSQRRCAEEQASRAFVRCHATGLQMRAKDGDPATLEFEGHASVTETPYEMWDMFGPYTEIVSADAFDSTLAQPELDVPLVLQHDSMRRIARTTNGSLLLSRDAVGLLVRAPSLDPADADVAYVAPKIRAGLIDEMSFKFDITAGRWSPDYTEYRINAVDIHRGDVAIVGYGANPHTAGSTLRSPAPKSGRQVVSETDLQPMRAL